MSYHNYNLYNELVEDIDMAEFVDDWLDIGVLPSDFKDAEVSLSPSHSCDSGVDIYHWMEDRFMSDFSDGSTKKSRVLEEGKGNMSVDVITINEDHCYTSKLFEQQRLPGILQKLKSDTDHSLTTSTKHETISDSSNDTENINDDSQSQGCKNRNALMAKLNRERKKRYVSNLESEASLLRKQNKELNDDNKELKNKLEDCSKMVKYLQNVLVNESMISSVINAVSTIPGINLYGRMQQNPTHHLNMDTELETITRKVNTVAKNTSNDTHKSKGIKYNEVSAMGSGVCLHIDKQNVSLEMCHHCSNHTTALSAIDI